MQYIRREHYIGLTSVVQSGAGDCNYTLLPEGGPYASTNNLAVTRRSGYIPSIAPKDKTVKKLFI